MSHRLRIMQVQLLKKLGSQRFIGQCAHSNAVLRFDVALLPATLAELDTLTLTNCQFDPHTLPTPFRRYAFPVNNISIGLVSPDNSKPKRM